MSDRERTHEGWSPLEQELLRSAREDAPSQGAGERMLVALGAGAGSVSKVALWGVAKWIGLGALGVVAVVAAVGTRTASSRPGTPGFASRSAPDPGRTSAVAAIDTESPATGASPEQPRSFVASRRSEPALGSHSATSKAGSGSASPVPPTSLDAHAAPKPTSQLPDLSGEMASLDAARSALRARQPALALRALDDYARAFPRGVLEPEAIVLHIDALLAQGHREEAVALAKRFLEGFPTSPHGPRMRAELGL